MTAPSFKRRSTKGTHHCIHRKGLPATSHESDNIITGIPATTAMITVSFTDTFSPENRGYHDKTISVNSWKIGPDSEEGSHGKLEVQEAFEKRQKALHSRKVWKHFCTWMRITGLCTIRVRSAKRHLRTPGTRKHCLTTPVTKWEYRKLGWQLIIWAVWKCFSWLRDAPNVYGIYKFPPVHIFKTNFPLKICKYQSHTPVYYKSCWPGRLSLI